jgi:hypothetical protein
VSGCRDGFWWAWLLGVVLALVALGTAFALENQHFTEAGRYCGSLNDRAASIQDSDPCDDALGTREGYVGVAQAAAVALGAIAAIGAAADTLTCRRRRANAEL